MKKNTVIKKILLEGSTQISAILPRAINDNSVNEDNFIYRFPVLLNKDYFTKNKDNFIDSFRIVFYQKIFFVNEFKSKIYTDTVNYKNFEGINSQNSTSINSMSDKISKNFFQDGSINSNFYTINYNDSNISNLDLLIYNINLSRSDSREIKSGKYNCMRIFSIKNDMVVGDTDFIYFDNDQFLNDVYESRRIYDLNYFIKDVYLRDFEKSLNMTFTTENGVNAIILKKSSQIESSILYGIVKININFENVSPPININTEISVEDFCIQTHGVKIILEDNELLNEITRLYLQGTDIFNFRVQCLFKVSPQINPLLPVYSIDKVYDKQIAFTREDSFITLISGLNKTRYLNFLFNTLRFKINHQVKDNCIAVSLLSDNISDERLLDIFEIKDIKVNNRSLSNGEIYLSENLTINDKVDFRDFSLFDVFSNNINSRSFSFFIKHNQISIFSKITIIIKSKNNQIDMTPINSEEFIINPDYKNLFNRVNTNLKNSISIISNGVVNSNIANVDSFSTYRNISLNNITQNFNNVAYNFGYFNQSSNINTETTSDVLDFLKNSVFCFEIEDVFPNIVNSNFKKKKYFYGKEIIKSTEIVNDFVEFNDNLLSYLSSDIDNLLENLSKSDARTKNTIKLLYSLSRIGNISNLEFDISNYLDFKNKNNFSYTKNLKIKMIPIPKLISLHKNIGIDENINITSNSDLTDSNKNNLTVQFIDLFYDKNSSLNWTKFLSFKKNYFSKDNVTINNDANSLYNMWNYLSSSIYIDKKNVTNFNESYNEDNIFEYLPNKKIQKNVNLYDINEIYVKNHFENFVSKYFNFSVNNNNFIEILDTGYVANFKNIDVSNNSPTNIELINTNINNQRKIDIDITKLLNYFNKSDILNMNFLAKLAIHPVLFNLSYLPVRSNVLNPYVNTNFEYNERKYITQSERYMASIKRKFFNEFNNNIDSTTSTITEVDESLILTFYLDNNRDLISKNTYNDMFNYCISNNTIFLKDFYLRLSLSFKIKEKYYFANVHKAIPRNNLNNTNISIVNTRGIKEV